MLNQLKENVLSEKNLVGVGIAIITAAAVVALPVILFCIAIAKIVKPKSI